MIEIDKVIRFIAKRGRCILQECFVREVVESIASRDIFFRKFKRNKLNVDKEIYNKARNQTWKLISQKKRENIAKKKLQENIAKPKEVWKKAFKSFGLSKKFSIAQTNAIEDNERFKDDLFLLLRL